MVFLGIEIGGTKLQLGVGPGDGTLSALWRGTVEVVSGPEGIRRQIMAAVPELLQQANADRSQVQGVGIGFGGPVDDATRTIIKSHQIAGWDGFPLADWITEITGWPAVLGNDADVAGLAEALFGAGKGLSPIFYITVGSGIGGGFIINGEIYRGCGRGAAEIGHLRCWLGPVVENVASGWAIANTARSEIAEHAKPSEDQSDVECEVFGGPMQSYFSQYNERIAKSELSRLAPPELAAITAQHVGDAARWGDEYAMEILNQALDGLAGAITQVIALLSPRRFVVGGGVSLMGEELWFRPLRDKVAEKVFKPFADCYDIVPAVLGEEVVVHGALALARRCLQRSEQ